jgi:hypothetical protein
MADMSESDELLSLADEGQPAKGKKATKKKIEAKKKQKSKKTTQRDTEVRRLIIFSRMHEGFNDIKYSCTLWFIYSL